MADSVPFDLCFPATIIVALQEATEEHMVSLEENSLTAHAKRDADQAHVQAEHPVHDCHALRALYVLCLMKLLALELADDAAMNTCVILRRIQLVVHSDDELSECYLRRRWRRCML